MPICKPAAVDPKKTMGLIIPISPLFLASCALLYRHRIPAVIPVRCHHQTVSFHVILDKPRLDLLVCFLLEVRGCELFNIRGILVVVPSCREGSHGLHALSLSRSITPGYPLPEIPPIAPEP